MKIAMMVRGYLPVPRPADMIYAPLDLAVAAAEGLAERGHDVTFFAPNGSELSSKVKVETLDIRPLAHNHQEFRGFLDDEAERARVVAPLWDKYFADKMIARAERGDFDLLHFHHPETGLNVARQHTTVPIIYTMHDPIYDWYREIFELYHSQNQHIISISKNQRRDAPDLPYISTVYNGVDPQHWPLSTTPEDYLLCGGRILPQKGIKEAIQVAKGSGHRLLIIGPTAKGASQDYFDQYIKPQLDDQILYLGFVERGQMWRYYQKAKAFLTPVQWEEPFGMTTIEAMACGTPVISLRRGAASEIITHGKTGFVVDSIAEMIDAVGKLDTVDRAACREHVKAHFSTSRMVDGYEAAYKKVLREQTNKQRVVRDLSILRSRLFRLPHKIRKNLQAETNIEQTVFAPFLLEEERGSVPGKPRPEVKKS